MSECCTNSNSQQYPRQHRCPVNGKEYSEVKLKTILHHINNPWAVNLASQGYYFCTDPNCQVVYFGQDGTTVSRSQMRTQVWQKNPHPDSTVCYCFGATLRQAATQTVKNYVIGKTRQTLCACEVANPSGRCCLKDFPEQKME